jgi:hypothetical protein
MYNINLTVHYETDDEYRHSLSNVFRSSPIERKKVDNEDNEDNEEYDNDTISAGLDFVYDKTKDNVLFQQLFQKASSLFVSTQMDIGLVTLFSYSYFNEFHLLLCDFLSNESSFSESNSHYTHLLARFTKTKS